MKKLQETEYMYGTARIRALENRLVGRERMAALLDAKSVGEVMARLSEYGITPTGEGDGARTAGDDTPEARSRAVEAMLLALLREAYRDVEDAAPVAEVFTWFRYPYDCNNIKMALKCRIRGISEEETRQMLFDFGSVPATVVIEAVRNSDFRAFPPAMAQVAGEASDAFAKSGDPRQIDARLDKACYADMLSAVAATGEGTLTSWVKARIDLTNAVICLRILRMGRGEVGRMFLEETLLPGGTLPPRFFTDAYDGATASGEDVLWTALGVSPYASFAKAVEATGKTPADVERCADDCWMAKVREDARMAFGAPVMAGYLIGWETAVKNIRILLAAKEAGLDGALIRERVRESYV